MDPGNVVGPVIQKITGVLFNFLGRQIGYVVHCKRNIMELEAGVATLRAEMQTVQGKVDRARDNAEEIEPNVSAWLTKAGALLQGADQFAAGGGSLKCCYGCCPNIRLRHRLGKEAEYKLKDVVQLTRDAKFDSVGHRRPLADIRLSTADCCQGWKSRAAAFNKIMEALKDDNVYTIGIYGMAGIGKTTMARDVAKKAKDNKSFDKIVQVSISQNPDLRKVQGEFADFLGLKLDLESLAGRASLVCERFKQKKEEKGEEKWEKILVILDDVWGQINIEEVGIPLNDYVKGCKIVVTSRTQGVLIGEGVGVEKEFRLGVLWENEAWSLFQKKVGNTIDSHHHELRSVAEEVCRECGGLPLAIVTLGAALNGKEPHQWIDALNQLKNCTAEYIDGMEAKAYLPIQLSYEFLRHIDTKACFLFCCLYPEDDEISIEELMWYGVGARFIRNRDTMETARARVSTIVDGLKASCLLLEGRDENSVKMHDIIRDVAISIASKDTQLMLLVKIGDKKWPDEEELKWCRTLSLMLEKDEALPDQLECSELRTLVLKCSDRNSVGGLDGFFKTTKKLEVLHLHNAILSPTIGSSISDLANLRMLCLHGCKLENVGFVGELKKLEILSFNGSVIEALGPEVKKLSHLRVLDLRRCDNSHGMSPGIISSLSYLEELYASDVSYLSDFAKWDREGNASIRELNSLQRLTNLEACIPEEVWSSQDLQCVSSLIRYKICIGCHFKTYENYAETRALKLRGIKLIGGAQVLTKKAKALYLNDPKGLQDWLRYMNGEWFLDLKFLKIENCEDEMEHLLGEPKWNIPSPISSASPLCKLSKLTVSNCRLKSLFSPSVIKCPPQLQKLGVKHCKSMVEIVGGDKEVGDEVLLVFPRLKKLELRSLPNLISFYGITTTQALFNGKVSFPVLEMLEIEDLDSIIIAIWDCQFNIQGASSFQLLKHFKVWRCEKLVNVVRSIVVPKFPDLVRLRVGACASLASIVEVVNIAKGFKIQTEAQQADDNDETLVFHKLESIQFIRLPNLKSFCSNFGSRKKERVEDQLFQIEPLFNYKVLFPMLQHLLIEDLKSITAIWDYQLKAQDSLQQLSMLIVRGCDKLEHLVASHLLLFSQSLKILEVCWCDSVKFLFGKDCKANDEILVFTQLKWLKLSNLPSLKSFYYTCTFDSHVEDMSPIKALFTHEVKLPFLKRLEIESIPNLRGIWDITVPTDSICKLEWLSVLGCNKLLHVAPSKLLKSFHEILNLRVGKCNLLEDIFRVEASNSTEEMAPVEMKNDLLLPHLQFVSLFNLPSLTSFYLRSCISKLMPSSVRLEIQNCPKFEKELAMHPGNHGRTYHMPGGTIAPPQLF